MTAPTPLYARFLRGLATSPAGPAVRFGGRTVGYEELHATAARWAGMLRALPEGPPATVGVLADKGITAYAGILAALYAGATVVPLHPAFPAARTRWMIEDAGVSLVLADDRGLAAMAGLGLDVPVVAPLRDGTATAPPAEPVPPDPAGIAYILFTSGSTGRPKGVPLSHANLDAYFQVFDRRYAFGPGDVFSQTLELNFDCSLVDMFGAWGAGAAVHAVPAQAFGDMPAFVDEHGLTVWFSTPSAIALVRRLGGLRPGSMPGLRMSYFAGEALLCKDVADWQAAAPASVVENLYGPTELTITITGHRWSAETSPGLSVNGIVPIGRVHEDHAMLLLDADGRPAEREGELCVTGPQMSAGYLDPAHDRGRFVERDGATWYRTGDRVRLLGNGELAYLGREDSQVQVQGLRVELSEVDAAVRSCAGVADAVTVAACRDGVTELVVYYTGAERAPVEFGRRLRALLPGGMIPRRFHHLAEFPLNANRKVDRGRLAREAAASP